MADDDEPKLDGKKQFTFWMGELDAAKKREKAFRDAGQDILDLYEAMANQPSPFNILYSNTETMIPALYSRPPRPLVERRFKDNDPLGKAVSQASTRMLEFLIDTNMDEYDDPHQAWKQATLSAALPGRGTLRVKYDSDVNEQGAMSYETCCLKIWSWKRFYHGYARTWSTVPWVCYEYDIDKDEAREKFGAVAAKLTFSSDDNSDANQNEKKDEQDKHKGERKTVRVYEFWDKRDKKVRFFVANYNEGPVKEEEDPLGLTGFFDCPRPLTFVDKHDTLVPTALYTLYKEQARELNEITRRILKITKALKARGVYAGDFSAELKKLMEADDNELVPAETTSSLAFEKGFQNAIWMLPLDQWIVVLRELMGVREQCKQTIYEITGISDILRGATKASETLGAQQLKSQWGGLRLKNKQAEVERYCRDTLRLMLDIASTKFSQDSWAQMTGLPFLTDQKAMQLQQIAIAAQQAAMTGDPQAQMQMQQIQQQMQTPKWADILNVLKNDFQRAYRIDIETNSTVEPEASEDRQDMMEMFQAIGQFIQGAAPLVQSGALSIEAVKAMLLIIVRRWRYGSEIEEYIMQMQQPTPPDQQGAEQVKKETEFAKKEIDMHKKQAEQEVKMKDMDFQVKAKQKELDLQMKEAQLNVDQQVFGMQQQAAEQTLQTKVQTEGAKLDFKNKEAQLQNGKFKTEEVAAKKVDSGMQKGLAGLEAMVKQLVQVVGQESKQHKEVMQSMMKELNRPRIKKAIRGKDGKLEGVEEQVA